MKGRCTIPIYLWKCEHCQVLTQVIRKVNDIEVKPGEPDDDKVVSECKESGHVWERQATAASLKLIGNWFGTTGGY